MRVVLIKVPIQKKSGNLSYAPRIYLKQIIIKQLFDLFGVQSQLESYQSHKKWYLMPPCSTLRIIIYESIEQLRKKNSALPYTLV